MKDESIIAYLNNECSLNEKSIIENWIRKSTENRHRFEELKTIWEHSEMDISQLPADHGPSWDRISKAVSEERSEIKTVRILQPGIFWRIAASAAIIIGLGYLSVRYLGGKYPVGAEMATVSTDSIRSDVELPDGSRVWLNSSTTISYPSKFSRKSRMVNLSGEAFFEVSRDRSRPFTVEFENSELTVLGTSFNINASDPQNRQVVTVVTGKVAFHDAADPSGGTILEQGDRGVYSALSGTYTREKNRDQNFLAWKTGILVFENTPLGEVCKVLQSHFGHQVLIEGPGNEERILTASFDNKELKDVMVVLTMTLDLSYRVEGDKYIIY